ncbi:MAG: cadherin domain-containing protein [Cytophagales bacterium]|nr:cadherin domain-containing protein [Cytophagales bacterium]
MTQKLPPTKYAIALMLLFLGWGHLLHSQEFTNPTITHYDISKYEHSGDADEFSVQSQDANPWGLAFNGDGTKMFMAGSDTDQVHEYTLTTAYDVSTATYVDGFSINDRESGLFGVKFSNDGTKMFTVGDQGKAVLEYALSTGFDVSTASFTRSLAMSTYDNFPTGLGFNDDGTKMFVVGNNDDRIVEFSLSTAFDLSSAAYAGAGEEFSIAGELTDPVGVTFSPDGMKMFVPGRVTSKIAEYALSTAYDVSTATFTASQTVSADVSNPTEVLFNGDGTKMLVLGRVNDAIAEYNSTASTSEVEFSEGNTAQVINVDANDGNGGATDSSVTYGLDGDDAASFSIDESGVVTFNTSPDYDTPSDTDTNNVYEFGINATANGQTENLAVNVTVRANPTDIALSNSSIAENEDAGTEVGTISATDADSQSHTFTLSGTDAASFSIDGTSLLSAASFDFETTNSYSITVTATDETGGAFSKDFTITVTDEGTPIFTNVAVVHYDISNYSHSGDADEFSVAAQDANPWGLAFNEDGTKMFMSGSDSDRVHEYTLTTAYDVSTATYVDGFSIQNRETGLFGVKFSNDGTKMFTVGDQGKAVLEYALGTSFDVSTATFTRSLLMSTYDNFPTGLGFNDDGTKMFMVGNNDNRIVEFSLSTAFNLSSATYAGATEEFNVGGELSDPVGVTFSPDGLKMFVPGRVTSKIAAYALTVAYDISTATFTASQTVTADVSNPTEVLFNGDGSKMLVLGRVNDAVAEYNSTATANAVNYSEGNTDTVLDVDANNGDNGANDTSVTYSLTGDDAAAFTISANGEIDFVTTPDYDTPGDSDMNNVYEIDVNATAGTLTTTVPLVVNVKALPSDITLSASTIAENEDTGTAIGTLSATDADSQSHTFTLSGTDAASFSIDGSSLLSAESFDFETTNSYSITVTATDETGGAFSKDFSITVTDEGTPVFTNVASAHYDISNYSHSGDTDEFSVQAQDANPWGLAFNSDGTKMFMAGSDSDQVHEYTLSTAYDVSTATYVDGISVQNRETGLFGVKFSNDGTKMFIVGDQGKSIVEYALATGYDVSTATFSSTLAMSTYDNFPTGMAFNDAGTKMYMIGNNDDRIVEFDLSTAFDLASATYAGSSEEFSVSSELTDPVGVTFNPDGTRMFVPGRVTSKIAEYALSTAYDVSTATFTASQTVSADVSNPTEVLFNGDGSKMLVLGRVNDAVAEYTSNSTTNVIDFSEGSTATVLDVDANDGDNGANDTSVTYSLSGDDAAEFAIDENGVITFATTPEYDAPVDADANNIYEININAIVGTNTTTLALTVNVRAIPTNIALSESTIAENEAIGTEIGTLSATDVDSETHTFTISGTDAESFSINGSFLLSAASFDFETTNSYSITVTATDATGGAFSKDFTITVTDEGTPVITSPVGSNFNITEYEHTGDADEFSVQAQDANPWGLAFNSDGTKMFMAGSDRDQVHEYTLATAYDVSTASYVDGFSIQDRETGLFGVKFSNDGTKMFIVGDQGKSIVEYNLATGYDVSTATFSSTLSMSTYDNFPTGMAFNNDGTKMYMIGNNDDRIVEFDLSTAFDLTSATYAGATEEFSVAGEVTDPVGVTFSPDGLKIFVPGRVTSKIVEYALTTAYDVSTASFTASQTVSADVSNPTEVLFNANGSKMLVLGRVNDAVAEYASTSEASNISYDENSSVTVADVDANDGDNGANDSSVTYSLQGDDADLFSIDATGAIMFNAAPDFENPTDANADNAYELEVFASANDLNDSVNLTINVINVNEAPIINVTLGELSILEDQESAVIVDLDSVFSDPEDDELTYTVSHDFGENVAVQLSETGVQVTPSADYNGSGTITATASDASGESVATSFTLTVTNVNDAPTVANNTPDQTVDEDATDATIGLTDIFTDIDPSDSLTLSVTSLNTQLVTASLDEFTLTLSFLANANGTSSVVATATDKDGLFVNDTITVTVNAVNDAPSFSLGQTNIEVDQDFDEAVSIAIIPNNLPSNEADQVVTYTVTSEEPNVVKASIGENAVILTALANASGMQTFTLTANDGQEVNDQFSTTFSVTVNLVLSTGTVNNGIRIYPNPVAETLFFDATNVIQVQVLTMDGKLIKKQEVRDQLDVSQLAPGAYVIRVIDGAEITTARILKRK